MAHQSFDTVIISRSSPALSKISHSGTCGDHYQDLDTLPCPSQLLESPPAICELPTLTILIPCSSSLPNMCQSPISLSCCRQMSISWIMFPRQILMYTIYSSILTPRKKTLCAWSCPSTYPISSTSGSLDKLFSDSPDKLFSNRVFQFDFYQFLIGLHKGDSLLVSPVLFS